jgi:hypothetical protein
MTSSLTARWMGTDKYSKKEANKDERNKERMMGGRI